MPNNVAPMNCSTLFEVAKQGWYWSQKLSANSFKASRNIRDRRVATKTQATIYSGIRYAMMIASAM